MREIKFRAWGNDHWVDWIPTCKTLGAYNASAIDADGYTFEKDNPFIVEQYTGLKDKNGKEIYEGDIVKGRWWRAKNARLDTKGEVKFNDGWFYIKDDPDGQDRLGIPIHNCYNMEVIGNIHENKELLDEWC